MTGTRGGSRCVRSSTGNSSGGRGGDWQVIEIFKVNLGAGFNLTSRGPGLVLKSRFANGIGEPAAIRDEACVWPVRL